MGNGTFLPWENEYSVGIEEIDKQHKELLTFVNLMINYSGGNAEAEKEYFKKIITVALQYFEQHFYTEETLMKEKQYPNYAEHKAKHDKMLEEMKTTLYEILEGKRALVLQEIAVYMRDWFLNHISESDKPLANFL